MYTVHWAGREWTAQLGYAVRWLGIITPVAAAIGTVVALFATLLNMATQARITHPWLLWLLPLAGVGITALYAVAGRNVSGGNNLIMEEIHEPGGGVPGRLAPVILISTIVTHLFGGSAGREGTAVQIGGSMASAYSRWWTRFAGRLAPLDGSDTRTLLMAGVAAGFGAVFGTPLAGAVFALEVLTIGRVDYLALVPCLFAALLGDWTCAAWGVRHTVYHIDVLRSSGIAHLDVLLLAKSAVAATAFGLASLLFAETTDLVHTGFTRFVRSPYLRPFIGGLIVIGLVYALGTRDYIGIGDIASTSNGVSITSSFRAGGATPMSWIWKLVFTAITLGSGFKGGEVTPLFFIGADAWEYTVRITTCTHGSFRCAGICRHSRRCHQHAAGVYAHGCRIVWRRRSGVHCDRLFSGVPIQWALRNLRIAARRYAQGRPVCRAGRVWRVTAGAGAIIVMQFPSR